MTPHTWKSALGVDAAADLDETRPHLAFRPIEEKIAPAAAPAIARPLRLVAQDIGFSVRRQGFDSPRGYLVGAGLSVVSDAAASSSPADDAAKGAGLCGGPCVEINSGRKGCVPVSR